MALPLEGMKVIELGVWVLGPSCTRILGELGADVIKVENPEGGDPVRGVITLIPEGARGPVNPLWEGWNSSKRAIAIDLNQEAGREVIYNLVKKSDVFVTNLRPVVVERFAMDYETLDMINPRIIYAQATGFGLQGPHKNRAAFDCTAFWIRSGIMSILGEPDDPPVPLRGSMGDLPTGIFLVCGILAAFLARERTGLGQKIDISLMSSGMWIAEDDIQRRLIWGELEKCPKYSRKEARNPLCNTYQTKDKKWLYLYMLQTDRFWPAVCKATERDDLENDPRFDSHRKRVENSQLIISILDKVISTKTLAEWRERFEQHGLIWEPETTIPEVLADPQISENNYVAEIEHASSGNLIKLLRVPFQFSKTPIGPRSSAPELGQHTEEVLLELGYDWQHISQLKEQKVIL